MVLEGTPNAEYPCDFQMRVEGLMSSTPYDILRRHNDGSLIWVEAASELSHAKDRLQQLNAAMPGDYFIFDQKSQQIVARVGPSLPPGD